MWMLVSDVVLGLEENCLVLCVVVVSVMNMQRDCLGATRLLGR
jgi:hypothetical protein